MAVPRRSVMDGDVTECVVPQNYVYHDTFPEMAVPMHSVSD